jgi:hypothetical protein
MNSPLHADHKEELFQKQRKSSVTLSASPAHTQHTCRRLQPFTHCCSYCSKLSLESCSSSAWAAASTGGSGSSSSSANKAAARAAASSTPQTGGAPSPPPPHLPAIAHTRTRFACASAPDAHTHPHHTILLYQLEPIFAKAQPRSIRVAVCLLQCGAHLVVQRLPQGIAATCSRHLHQRLHQGLAKCVAVLPITLPVVRWI